VAEPVPPPARFCADLEEVRECHHLTGGDDFLLKVTTTNMADLEALIEALLPYGNPVTSLVLSSPIERRRYAVTGKLLPSRASRLRADAERATPLMARSL